MKSFFVLFLLFTPLVYGGDRVGNGGDVVYCESYPADLFFVFEEYEGNVHARIGSSELDYSQKVEILISRLRKYFPVRSAYYSYLFKYFKQNVVFLDRRLPEISDERSFPDRSNSCEIVQAAYFNWSVGQPKYFIQKIIWNKLDNDQKAILVFHELIYTEAAGLGHQDSYFVRQLNRMVYTGLFDAASFDGKMIVPLIKEVPGLSNLESIFSERVALSVLNKDLSHLYSDKKFRPILKMIKTRFSSSPRVVEVINRILRQVNES